VEAWYAGSKGADAVANILFGEVNPSAKLPLLFLLTSPTFRIPGCRNPLRTVSGLAAVMKTGEAKPTFAVQYEEGLKVGYKWYDVEKKEVLFPFGFGLSYTKFEYAGLQVRAGDGVILNFTVKNTGQPGRSGDRRSLRHVAQWFR